MNQNQAAQNHELAVKKSVVLRRFESDPESEEERRRLKLPLDFGCGTVMHREKVLDNATTYWSLNSWLFEGYYCVAENSW